ncbi:Uncharacterised protein [Acinetobacter phage MD-2021a]|nr:Uncharacterised protein [Acinetobacter phage MD-2021a]CAH1088917.1 Uncharacterised protein [Acinetobacter phage MD-2021a]HCH8414749.1 hypothetical protein [Salmonella enterica]
MSKVEVDVDKLRSLIKAQYKLECLECGGVDNWSWYGESLSCEESEGTPYWDFCEEVDEASDNDLLNYL